MAVGASRRDLQRYILIDLIPLLLAPWIFALGVVMQPFFVILIGQGSASLYDLRYRFQAMGIILALLLLMAGLVAAIISRRLSRLTLSDFLRGIQHD